MKANMDLVNFIQFLDMVKHTLMHYSLLIFSLLVKTSIIQVMIINKKGAKCLQLISFHCIRAFIIQ